MNISKGSLYSHGVIFYISAKRFFCLYKTDKHVAYQTTGSEFSTRLDLRKPITNRYFDSLLSFAPISVRVVGPHGNIATIDATGYIAVFGYTKQT